VPELIGSDLCGLLVPPRDPSALAAALILLLQDPKLYKKITQNALKRADFFSSDRFCADILKLARSLSIKKMKNYKPN
jgi:glycosyltransferase involved in cell wall biosynthesis